MDYFLAWRVTDEQSGLSLCVFPPLIISSTERIAAFRSERKDSKTKQIFIEK